MSYTCFSSFSPLNHQTINLQELHLKPKLRDWSPEYWQIGRRIILVEDLISTKQIVEATASNNTIITHASILLATVDDNTSTCIPMEGRFLVKLRDLSCLYSGGNLRTGNNVSPFKGFKMSSYYIFPYSDEYQIDNSGAKSIDGIFDIVAFYGSSLTSYFSVLRQIIITEKTDHPGSDSGIIYKTCPSRWVNRIEGRWMGTDGYEFVRGGFSLSYYKEIKKAVNKVFLIENNFNWATRINVTYLLSLILNELSGKTQAIEDRRHVPMSEMTGVSKITISLTSHLVLASERVGKKAPKTRLLLDILIKTLIECFTIEAGYGVVSEYYSRNLLIEMNSLLGFVITRAHFCFLDCFKTNTLETQDQFSSDMYRLRNLGLDFYFTVATQRIIDHVTCYFLVTSETIAGLEHPRFPGIKVPESIPSVWFLPGLRAVEEKEVYDQESHPGAFWRNTLLMWPHPCDTYVTKKAKSRSVLDLANGFFCPVVQPNLWVYDSDCIATNDALLAYKLEFRLIEFEYFYWPVECWAIKDNRCTRMISYTVPFSYNDVIQTFRLIEKKIGDSAYIVFSYLVLPKGAPIMASYHKYECCEGVVEMYHSRYFSLLVQDPSHDVDQCYRMKVLPKLLYNELESLKIRSESPQNKLRSAKWYSNSEFCDSHVLNLPGRIYQLIKYKKNFDLYGGGRFRGINGEFARGLLFNLLFFLWDSIGVGVPVRQNAHGRIPWCYWRLHDCTISVVGKNLHIGKILLNSRHSLEEIDGMMWTWEELNDMSLDSITKSGSPESYIFKQKRTVLHEIPNLE